MPYEYRSLTPEEREKVILHRRELGYPLHAPPHPYRQAGFYLITAANFEHAPVMGAPGRRTEFESRLLATMADSDLEITGWVVLPNHYHILVGVKELDQISAAIKQLHGTTSRSWNQEDHITGKRRVWYKFTDRLIRNEQHYIQAMNYNHFNPVKHQYTQDPYEWLWSSILDYYATYGREWLRAAWEKSPPGDFGKGWDD